MVAALLCILAAPAAAQLTDPEHRAPVERKLQAIADRASVAQASGNVPEHVEALEQAEGLVVKLDGEGSFAHVSLLKNLARVLRGDGRFEQADTVLDRVLGLMDKHWAEGSSSVLEVRVVRARNWRDLGRIAEAEHELRKVLATFDEQFGLDQSIRASAELNLAAILSDRRDYSGGERLARSALETFARIEGDAGPDTRDAKALLAAILRFQGDREAAFALLKTLTPSPGEGSRAETLLIGAGRAIDSGQPTKAEGLLGQAVEEARATSDPLLLATLLEAQGQFYRQLEDPVAANVLFAEAYELRRQVQGEDHYATLTVLNSIANTLVEANELAAAENIFGDVLARLEKRDMQQSALYRDLLYNMTVARIAQPDRRHSAIEPMTLLAAIEIDRRRVFGSGYRSDGAQATREIEARGIFALHAETMWAASGDSPDAKQRYAASSFLALQEAVANPASRALAERQAIARALRAGGKLGQSVSRRQELVDSIANTENAMLADFAETSALALGRDRRFALEGELTRLRNELGEVERSINSLDHTFFSQLQPEPLQLKAAQALLADGEAILLVVPGQYGTHAIALTSQESLWFRPQWTADEIGDAVVSLLWDVGADVAVDDETYVRLGLGSRSAISFDLVTAHRLYAEVVAPARGILANTEHLFVVGAGSLSKLPFSMLVSDPPKEGAVGPDALRETSWLADDYALVQLPSVQSLALLREQRQRDASTGDRVPFMGFGDPVLTGAPWDRGQRRIRGSSGTGELRFDRAFATTGGTRSLANPETLRAMARLPGTAVELTALWRAFGEPEGALWLAEDATEREVKETKLSADIIIFSTHGLLAGDVDGNAEPGLVLTPPISASELDDGLLASSEIAGLQIDADWVILSACDTAGGDGRDQAAGLSGIAQAFFQAGAGSLLASHWPVRDDVTPQLVLRTVELLQSGADMSRAQAFQRAMREVRNDDRADHRDKGGGSWAHPSAWAPFVLIGDVTGR
ncbi:MAG: CHAT domain-containing protein [Altererythrobacter sp.]